MENFGNIKSDETVGNSNHGQFADDEKTSLVDVSPVKNETTFEDAEHIKCAFCTESVPNSDIVLHTQMHTLEWEKENGQDDSDSDGTDDEDNKVELNGKDGKKEAVANLQDGELVNCSLCQKTVPKITIYE